MDLPIKTILAAVDLDDDLSDAVIKTAVSLSERLGAKLHVIDAWPPMKGIGFPYAKKAAVAEIEKDEAKRRARSNALEAKLATRRPGAITFAPVGHAADAIERYLEDESIDLLVIGSHQKGLWQRITSGTVSSDVAHDAPCAVLLVNRNFAARV